MRLILPALALSSFMGFRTAADAELLINAIKTPAAPTIPVALTKTLEPPPLTLNDVVMASARKHGIAPAFIRGVIAAESGGNNDAISPKGAIGLMQLMPQTAMENGAKDPTDPAQNIDAGTAYLKRLMQRYGSDGRGLERAVAAYNAGPGNVDKYRGIPPFKETRNYVKKVLGFYKFFSLNRWRGHGKAMDAPVNAD